MATYSMTSVRLGGGTVVSTISTISTIFTYLLANSGQCRGSGELQKVCRGRVSALVPHHHRDCRFLDSRDQSTHAAAGAGVTNTYTRVAQIKKVIVLMAYFVFSDH